MKKDRAIKKASDVSRQEEFVLEIWKVWNDFHDRMIERSLSEYPSKERLFLSISFSGIFVKDNSLLFKEFHELINKFILFKIGTIESSFKFRR